MTPSPGALRSADALVTHLNARMKHEKDASLYRSIVAEIIDRECGTAELVKALQDISHFLDVPKGLHAAYVMMDIARAALAKHQP